MFLLLLLLHLCLLLLRGEALPRSAESTFFFARRGRPVFRLISIIIIVAIILARSPLLRFHGEPLPRKRLVVFIPLVSSSSSQRVSSLQVGEESLPCRSASYSS